MMKWTETLSLVIFNLLALSHNAFAQKVIENLSCDFNDYSLCDWSFGGEAHFEAIFNYTNYDYDNAQADLILLLRPGEEHKKDHFVTFSLQSPAFDSGGDYELSFNVNMNFVGNIFVVVAQSDSGKSTESQILKITSNRKQKWDLYSIKLPRNSRISVMLEIKFDPDQIDFEHDYIAVNNLNIIDKKPPSNKCDYKCESNEQCLPSDAICDTRSDCPQGEDERLHCDKLPSGSYCNFQSNFCHWFNEDAANSSGQWMHIGSSAAADGYLAVAFKGVHRFATLTYLKSVVFEPIPLYHSMASSKYHKSCRARFSYLFGTSSSDLSLELEPQLDHEKQPNTIVWRKFNRQKAFGTWENVSISLPLNVHHKYRLIFGAGLGLKTFSAFNEKISVAIDNFSLSKECFGIDVPESEPRVPAFIPSLIRGKPFTIPQNKSIKSYTFTSCGAVGRIGPTYSQCESFYLNSSTRAAVFENTNDLSLNGSQMWTVPKSAYYTIFALGASGGKGLHNETGGRGSLVRAAFWFQEGDTIFISVGQAGADACSEQTEHFDACKSDVHLANPTATPPKGFVKSRSDVGGGGGGATYVFKMNPHQKMKYVPLLIAGGGGGGAGKLNADIKYKKQMHGRGLDVYNLGSAGNGDGAGGGWRKESTANNQTGQSLLSGAHGGLPCRRLAKWQVNGGFGGGGGACSHGGAGGGFHGGNINKVSEAGDGGTSYADFELSHLQLYSDFDFEPSLALTGRSGGHRASAGLVVIVPQIDGCCNGGRYPCLVTGQSLNGSLMRQCVCGDNKFMEDLCVYERPFYLTILWITLCFMVLMFIVIFVTYIYIQKRKLRHKISRNESNDLHLLSNSSSLSAADLQLSRLRHNILTEYNPNYEFGGSTCTLQDLREISREKLTLVKALGNGAFGEVYQGCLHNHPGEVTDELPVAIKTLPEYNTSKQAEMDFVMEALIMSKFKHRNIVRFIGICFERMPRFIVLELLPGGDLKSFLRENRATIDSPTTLVMGDLLVMALDIACGCLYLEEHHFIHRDIAARNCLLTSKVKMPSSLNSSYTPSGTLDINQFKNGFNNSGLIAKIADFGMARDIYRADYYRKGGKAMLPVKWMPPEAFLDGVFTSKTDIWSFGVLLWEVMSMGYMPYPGRGNQEVMHLVTNNQRLEPPNSSTPPQVYAIMTQCWNGTPEFRPSFGTIIERLGYCLQDPDVINVPLPIFHRSASMEKDMTAAMRPPQDSTDYLMPNNPGSQTNSNYSMATEKTELLSQDTCSTLSCVPDDKLLEIDDHHQLQHPNNAVKLWNDEAVIAQQTGMMQPAGPGTSYNAAVNLGSAYPSIKVPFTTGVVLNPMNLSYQQQQQQQPCVRYVNVSAFGVTPAAQAPVNHTQQVNSEQPPSAEAPPAPINC